MTAVRAEEKAQDLVVECAELIKQLTSDSTDVRQSAVMALTQHSRLATVRTSLVASLRDPVEAVRIAAATALQNWLSDAQVSTVLVAWLTDPSDEIRLVAVQILASWTHDPKIRDRLVLRLKDRAGAVRAAAAVALLYYANHPDVQTALASLANDPAVRAAVLPWATSRNVRRRRGAFELLAAVKDCDDAIENILTKAAIHKDWLLRGLAVRGLEPYAEYPQVQQLLAARLTDDEPDTRRTTVRILNAQPPTPLLRDAILQQLPGSTGVRRQSILDALKRYKNDPVVQAMLHAKAKEATANLMPVDPTQIEALLQRLVAREVDERAAAITDLVPHLANPQVRDALIALVQEAQPTQRVAGIRALAPSITIFAVRHTVRNRLADPVIEVRLAAAQALFHDTVGESRKQALYALVPHLSDPDVRDTVITQLAAEEDDWLREAIVRELGPSASDPLIRAALIGRLVDRASRVATAAFETLAAYIHNPGLQADLVAWLGHKSAQRRRIALRLLTQVKQLAGDSPFPPQYIDLLRHESEALRVIAARTLKAQSADPIVRAALSGGLTDTAERVRQEAVTALAAEAGRLDVRAALLERLEDPSAGVRMSAITTLGTQLQDGDVCAAILARLSDQAEKVKFAALKVCADRCDDSSVQLALVPLLVTGFQTVRTAVADILRPYATSPTIRQALLVLLDNPSPLTRGRAVDALAEQANEADVQEALRRCLHDRHPTVRVAATQALTSQLDVPEIRQDLLRQLDDTAALAVRIAAIQALKARVTDLAVRDALVQCLTDPATEVQEHAVNALAAYTQDPVVDAGLLKRLNAGPVTVRRRILDLLRFRGDESEIRTALRARLRDEDSIAREYAIEALSRYAHDPQVQPHLLELLKDPAERVRHAILYALLLTPSGTDLAATPMRQLAKIPEDAQLTVVRAFAAALPRLVWGRMSFELDTDENSSVSSYFALLIQTLVAYSDDPEVARSLMQLLAYREARASLQPILQAPLNAALRTALLEKLSDPKANLPSQQTVLTVLAAHADDPEVRVTLVEQLKDKRSGMRAYIVRALESQLTDPGIRSQIERMRADPAEQVRAAATRALKRAAFADTEDSSGVALSDRPIQQSRPSSGSNQVSTSSADEVLTNIEFLTGLPNDEYEPYLHRNLLRAGQMLTTAKVSSMVSAAIVEHLLVLFLNTEATGLIVAAGDVLHTLLATPLEPVIVERVRQATNYLRHRHIDRIGVLSDNPAIREDLMQTLRTDPWAAAPALRTQTNNPQVRAALVALLRSKDDFVRARVVYALAPAAADPVIRTHYLALLKDKDRYVRFTTVQELVPYATQPDVYDALLPLLKDKDKLVRWQVGEALSSAAQAETLRTQMISLLVGPDLAYRRGTVEALAAHVADPRVRDALTRSLNDSAASVRVSAARALRMASPAATVRTALLAHFNDRASSVRLTVIRALGQYSSDPEVRATLEQLLTAQEPYLREAGIRALAAACPTPPIAAKLANLLMDPNPAVRCAAAKALGAHQPAARAVLVALLDDSDSLVQRWSIEALQEQMTRPEIYAALQKRLNSEDFFIQEAVIKALGNAPPDLRILAQLGAMLDSRLLTDAAFATLSRWAPAEGPVPHPVQAVD